MKHQLIAAVAIFLLSCTNESRELYPDVEKFSPTFEVPFTNELKFYHYGIQYWNKRSNHTDHFPEKLVQRFEYEFFFVPRMMQGSSRIALKIKYPNLEEAQKYYNEKSKSIVVEFKSSDEYQKSIYCNLEEFGFESKYKLHSNVEIRLLRGPWCSGQGDRILGGILEGIALDKGNSSVICWVDDRTN